MTSIWEFLGTLVRSAHKKKEASHSVWLVNLRDSVVLIRKCFLLSLYLSHCAQVCLETRVLMWHVQRCRNTMRSLDVDRSFSRESAVLTGNDEFRVFLEVWVWMQRKKKLEFFLCEVWFSVRISVKLRINFYFLVFVWVYDSVLVLVSLSEKKKCFLRL